MTDQLPRQFGKYLLERRLGVGGMAETFVARREGKAGIVQHVCIKRVLPAFHRDPEFLKQFQREARLAAKLRHQNIVQVLDFGYVGETLYMALELVRGVDLRDFLQAQPGKKLAPEYVAIIAHDMVYALDYAHRPHDGVDGIVHRDVTPSNVLLSRNGHAKLADFGVAKAIGTSTVATATGIMKGKMPYMPTEQMKGGAVDGRTDLFSLGVVLFEALAGRRPFTGAHDVEVMTKIVSNTRPKLKDVAPHVPDGFCDVVEKLLEPEPEDRFPNADAVLDAIAPFVPTPKWRRQLATMVRECYGDAERDPEERDTRMADVAELPANVPGAIQVPSNPPPPMGSLHGGALQGGSGDGGSVDGGSIDGEAPTAMALSQPPPPAASDDAPTRMGPSERPQVAGRSATLYGVGPSDRPPPPEQGSNAPTHLDLAAQARAAAAAGAARGAAGAFADETTDRESTGGAYADEAAEQTPPAGASPPDEPDTDRSGPPRFTPPTAATQLIAQSPARPAEREPSGHGPAKVVALAAAALLIIAGGTAALFALAGDSTPEPIAETQPTPALPPTASEPTPSEPEGDLPVGVEPPELDGPEATDSTPEAAAAPVSAMGAQTDGPSEPAAAPGENPAPAQMRERATMEAEERLVEVSVTCSPWGEVWVGERYMGRAPVRLRLPPGTHAIRAGAGRPQFTKRVRVRRRPVNVSFDLDTLMQESAEMR